MFVWVDVCLGCCVGLLLCLCQSWFECVVVLYVLEFVALFGLFGCLGWVYYGWFGLKVFGYWLVCLIDLNWVVICDVCILDGLLLKSGCQLFCVGDLRVIVWYGSCLIVVQIAGVGIVALC